MKKVFSFVDKVSTPFLISCASFIMVMQFWALNKGYVMSDEGWFSILLRDQPAERLATQYHLLFGGIFNNNLYATRVCAWILEVVAAAIMSFGIFKYRKCVDTTEFLKCFSCIIIGYSVLGPISINYAVLTLIVGELSLGFLLLGVCSQKTFYYFLCGFFIATLFPIKITAVVVIPLMLLVMYYCERGFKSVIYTLVGMMAFIAIFFVFVMSPDDYLSLFSSNTKSTIAKGNGNYGIWFLLKGWKGVFVFIFDLVLISTYVVSIKKLWVKKYIKKSVFVILIFVLVIYLLFDNIVVIKGKGIGNTRYLYWIFAFSLLISSWNKDYKKLCLVCLLLAVPFCLSFGSDAPVYSKPHYVPFVMGAVLLQLNGRLHNCVLVVLVLVNMYSFAYGITKYDWAGNKWLAQTERVSNIGINQNLKLDKRVLSEVEKVKSFVTPGDKVICDQFGWGMVELLDLKPMSYSFALNVKNDINDVEKCIENNETLIVLVEDNVMSKELIEYLDSKDCFVKFKYGWDDYLYKFEGKKQ